MKKIMVAISVLVMLGVVFINTITPTADSGMSTVSPSDAQFPTIDAHAHLGGSFDWDTIIKAMDKKGVSKQIVIARYYKGPAGSKDLPGDDEMALKLAEKYPGRFYPLVGMQRPGLTGAYFFLLSDMVGIDASNLFLTGSFKGSTHRFSEGL